jgi:hypothetical protein
LELECSGYYNVVLYDLSGHYGSLCIPILIGPNMIPYQIRIVQLDEINNKITVSLVPNDPSVASARTLTLDLPSAVAGQLKRSALLQQLELLREQLAPLEGALLDQWLPQASSRVPPPTEEEKDARRRADVIQVNQVIGAIGIVGTAIGNATINETPPAI